MRRMPATFAAAAAGTVALALAVPSSAAFWVDREYVTASLGAIECGDPGVFDTTAWGRVLTGELAGASLEPVGAIDGITVDHVDPATSSAATSQLAVVDLGSDAWSTALPLVTIPGLTVGPGLTLPFENSTGAYTQYGRATSGGLSVGASGAITAAAGGVVALDEPGEGEPRQATLRLSTLLDAVLEDGDLGATTSELADAGLRIGTIGALARLDSCDVLWDGLADPGTALQREYLVDDLGLEFGSSLVTDAAGDLRTAVQDLETALDALLAPGTSVTGSTLSTLTGILGGLLDISLLGINLDLAAVDSMTVGIDFDLAPVLDAITGERSDGVVTIDLDDGEVTADLAALAGAAYGSDGLNGLPPNTPVLTPAVLADLSGRVGGLLTGLVDEDLDALLATALDAATVTVEVDAGVRTQLGIINVVGLDAHIEIVGTVAGFLGAEDAPAPVADVTATQANGLLATILATIGINLAQLVNGLDAALVGPLVEQFVPAVGSLVVAPVIATAQTLVAGTVSGLTGTTIPALVTALGGVLGVLRQLVDVTVNAQPDQPDGVGAPADAPAGRWFETALHVGVVDADAASLASLYLASASVGPNALR